MTITKSDITNYLANRSGLTKSKANEAVENVFGYIVDSLRKGDKVTVVGFGTFDVRTTKPRTGRDPRRGTTIHIPAKRVPTFKAGKQLKDMVAGA